MPEHPLLNFFDQLKIDNTYELFFPKKEQGLVIIWLYEKIKNKTFPNGIFKEADIQQAFQEISLLSREKIERNPWDHYNSHIMALQEFFLIYNEEDQTYKLRDYAEHICKKIYTILSNRFNPTIIEITCMDLAAKLNSIGSPTDLQNWLDVHLDKSKFVLKEQIDFLQQQIDTTIQALRDKAKLKDCTLTDTLKQVEEDLDKIRQQNKELRGAFRETKKIKNGLLDHPFRDSSDETDEKTAEAIDYFEEIRVSLDMVDSRIDRLQTVFQCSQPPVVQYPGEQVPELPAEPFFHTEQPTRSTGTGIPFCHAYSNHHFHGHSAADRTVSGAYQPKQHLHRRSAKKRQGIQCRAYKTETAKPGRSVDFAHPGPKEIPERYPFIEIVFPDSRRKSGRYTTGADCHLSAHQSI